uniref:Uncharacterized protein n=1 Tax=Lepeophtheirus salmonis TaxID=72036 RepID=A0A0K2SXZ4_LEPSM
MTEDYIHRHLKAVIGAQGSYSKN